ncbi:hypothetical protein [Streptomyces sp. NPDC052114]|uniref:hypothetical protein n=1 Tax=unclassified Streptomyces TaxID=2593676 RepID=UPI0034391DC0
MGKTQTPDLSWAREADQEWADRVRVRLVLDHDAPAGLADEVLSEAHQVVTEADLPASEVLGTADAYARTVAAERISEEHRAKVDANGLTPGERVSASLGTFGFIGFVLCVLYWIEDGLWVSGSWTSVAGCTTVVVVVSLVTLAFVARAAGRMRGMWGFLAGAACAVAGGAAVLSALPDAQLFEVPVPVLMAGCVAWAVGVYLFPDAVLDRWFTPRPHADDEQWLTRLEGLLRGRHAMTAAEARGHVQEARQHLAAPGGERADDTFGDVEVYAMRLAEGPRKRQRIARHKLYRAVAMAGILVVLAVDEAVRSGFTGWFACYVGAAGAWLWGVLGEWRQSRGPAGAGASR